MDLYRSKGSARAVELFFKLIYGKNASVYLPSEHIFKASDAIYVEPRYVELFTTNDAVLKSFMGNQITGSKSGATAFVGSVVEMRGRNPTKQSFTTSAYNNLGSTLLHVLYLENLEGEFVANEIVTDGTYEARLNGSLSNVSVIFSGPNFSVGEEVEVLSAAGSAIPGVMRVTSVRSASGVPDFKLLEGGSGYSTNASYSNVVVSTNVLEVNAISNTHTSATFYLDSEVGIVDDTIALEDFYQQGRIILEDDGFISNHSTRRANTFQQYETIFYPACSIGFTSSNNIYLTQTSNSSLHVTAIEVASGQTVANGKVSTSSNAEGQFTNGTVEVFVTTGSFLGLDSSTHYLTLNGNSSANATWANATNNYLTSQFVGFKDVVGSSTSKLLGTTSNTGIFYATPSAFIQGTTSNTVAHLVGNRSPSVVSSLKIHEISVPVLANVYTDMLNDAASYSSSVLLVDNRLNNTAFGFSKSNSANVDSRIETALVSANGELLGEVSQFRTISSGSDYTADPIVTIQNKFLDGHFQSDKQIKFTQKAIAKEDFNVGDVLRQTHLLETQSLTFTNFGSTNTQNFNAGDGVVQVVNSTVNNYATVNSVANATTLILQDSKTVNSTSYVTAYGHDVGWTANQVLQLTASANTLNTIASRTATNTNMLFVGKILSTNTANNTMTIKTMTPFIDPMPTKTTRVSRIILEEGASGSATDTTSALTTETGIIGLEEDTTVLNHRLQSNTNSKSADILEVADAVSSSTDEFINYDSGKRLGLNGDLVGLVETGNNLINTVAMVESGYRFKQGEQLFFRSTTNKVNGEGIQLTANATAIVEGTGFARGFHKSQTGFLNDEVSRVHDNHYYQAFSYQVDSEFSLDKYEKILKDVIHTSGYKLFGKSVITPFVSSNTQLISTSTTVIQSQS